MPAKTKTTRGNDNGRVLKLTRSTGARTKTSEAGDTTDSAVRGFLRELKHPLKPAVEIIRQTILGVSPGVHEGIKWNAPSFRTTEHFATFNLARAKDHVILILHTGAKPRNLKLKGLVADPKGLLKWLAEDRCLVTFDSLQDVEAKRPALAAIIGDWIQHV